MTPPCTDTAASASSISGMHRRLAEGPTIWRTRHVDRVHLSRLRCMHHRRFHRLTTAACIFKGINRHQLCGLGAATSFTKEADHLERCLAQPAIRARQACEYFDCAELHRFDAALVGVAEALNDCERRSAQCCCTFASRLTWQQQVFGVQFVSHAEVSGEAQ